MEGASENGEVGKNLQGISWVCMDLDSTRILSHHDYTPYSGALAA